MKHCANCKHLEFIIQDEIVCKPPGPVGVNEMHSKIEAGRVCIWCDLFEERVTASEAK